MTHSLAGRDRHRAQARMCWREVLQGGLRGEIAEGWTVEMLSDLERDVRRPMA